MGRRRKGGWRGTTGDIHHGGAGGEEHVASGRVAGPSWASDVTLGTMRNPAELRQENCMGRGGS